MLSKQPFLLPATIRISANRIREHNMKQLLTKIEKLKTLKQNDKKSRDELIDLLKSFSYSNDILIESPNVRFLLISVLIAQIVPCYYGDDIEINLMIERLLNNLQSLNILLNKLQSRKDSVQAVQKYPQLILHMIFGNNIIDLLHRYLTNNNTLTRLFILKQNLKDIQNIFFDDKLLATVYPFKDIIGDDTFFEILFNKSKYSSWLVHQYYSIIKEDNLDYSNLTFSLFRRRGTDALREILIKDNSASLLDFKNRVFSRFSNTHRIKFITTFVFRFLIADVFSKSILTEIEKISVIDYCFNQLNILKISEDVAYAIFENQALTPLNQNLLVYGLVANLNNNLSPAEFSDQFMKIIVNYWANESLIKDKSTHFQNALTLFVLYSLNFLEHDFLKKLVVDLEVLRSTTIHMEHSNEEIRYMGILFMETLSKMTNTELNFNMDSMKAFAKRLILIDHKDITILRDISNIKKKILMIQTDNKRATDLRSTKMLSIKEFQRVSTMLNDLNEISDSDDEDYDDPTMATHNNALPYVPVYLKDLNDYLTASLKETPFHAQLKRKIGLKSFSKLVRYKFIHNLDELKFWGKKLCPVIVNIKIDSLVTKGDKSVINIEGKVTRKEINNGKESEEYFNHIKLLCLISLCVCLPLEIPCYLIEILLSLGNLSIFDRLMILNSIGLAARELKGYNDDVNYKNLSLNLQNQNKLVTHDQFMELQESHLLDNVNDNMESQISSVASASNNIENQFIHSNGGKTVKISSKLLKQREEKSKRVNKKVNIINKDRDNYTKISSEAFIKPYLLIWYTLQGDMNTLGTHSSMFILNYMKTLNILIYCCEYPQFDLIRDLLAIFIQFKHSYANILNSKNTKHEKLEFLKSGMYLLLIVLNHKTLVSNFKQEIIQIFDWLNYLFEELNDKDEDESFIKGLVANCLLSIQDILSNY